MQRALHTKQKTTFDFAELGNFGAECFVHLRVGFLKRKHRTQRSVGLEVVVDVVCVKVFVRRQELRGFLLLAWVVVLRLPQLLLLPMGVFRMVKLIV